MIYWIIFGAFTAIFIGSFLREKRAGFAKGGKHNACGFVSIRCHA